jgi:LuxR family maltose regulon positive regulatory protein
MNDQILLTKFHIPTWKVTGITRTRLLEQLTHGVTQRNKLILVSAPAGYGKSTLVGEWLQIQQKRGYEIAWLSLDQNDNDLVRFLVYFVSAFQQTSSSLNQMIHPYLTQPVEPAVFNVMDTLINQLTTLKSPLVITLDDYHVITNPQIHEALNYFLEYLPNQLHLIITTRQDPPLRLAWLRARGELTEIRAQDLRFNNSEIRQFYSTSMKLNLTEEDLTALEERTEGWVVGLQLAGLALQNLPDKQSFIKNFRGSQRYILDYLVDEVFRQQSEEICTFLIQTSILDNFNADICNALTGQTNAQEMFHQLESENLFIVPLDDERLWFRYHHLFADLLRARLNLAEPETVYTLHLKAANWYESYGYITKAVWHTMAAKEFTQAADLIEKHGQSRWSVNDIDFMSLVSKLPDEIVQTRPNLTIYYAWILFIFGQYETSENLLHDIKNNRHPAGQTQENSELITFVDLLLLYISEMKETEPSGVLPNREVLSFVPEEHLGMRNTADVLYAYLLDLQGDFKASEELLLSTVQRDITQNGYTAVAICITRLVRNLMIQGKLNKASSLCQTYITYIQERGEKRFFIGGNLYMSLANIFCEWNDLEKAAELLEKGIEANTPWKFPLVFLTHYLSKAKLQKAQGDIDGALTTLDQLDLLIQGKSTTPELKSDLRSLKVKLLLAKNDHQTARSMLQFLHPIEPLSLRNEADHILLARFYLAEGQWSKALTLLEKLTAYATSGKRYGRLLEVQLLEVLALNELNQLPQADKILGSCLALAEPEGYLRIFLDEGEPMRIILSDYCRDKKPIHRSYCIKILNSFSGENSSPNPNQETLVEPLSQRELEVLQLICAGDSNQEIAQKLFITVSGVKKHTSNIYGKLGVNSRTQAVAQAHELGLLSFKK